MINLDIFWDLNDFDQVEQLSLPRDKADMEIWIPRINCISCIYSGDDLPYTNFIIFNNGTVEAFE